MVLWNSYVIPQSHPVLDMLHMILNFSNIKLVVEKRFLCIMPTGCKESCGNLNSNQYSRGYIIDYLNMKFQAYSDTAVIYYFFDSSERKTLKTSNFLRCILHQAIKMESLLPDSQRILESLFKDQIYQSEPTTSELEQIFFHFYGKFKSAFLLIDGLDEANDVEQRNVKSFLKTVQKMDGARIFTTTHAAMDMSKVFTRGLALQIKPKDLEDDIETFIQSQIDKYSQGELCDCSPSMLDIIKRKLVSDAQGMLVASL